MPDQEGDENLCKVIVQVNYPHSRVSGGRINSWQLYAPHGMRTMQSHARNFICIVVSEKLAEIGPGTGSIKWSVKDELFPGTVSFPVK